MEELNENENSMEPIRIFAEEMKGSSVERRLTAIKKLETLAVSLGPERTRRELIPILNAMSEGEEEILFQLAAAMGNFGPLVGGGDHLLLLLPLLEKLASEEETIVREKAVDSLVTIVSALTKKSVQDNIMAMIRRLLKGDWFSERISAAGLFHVVYPQVDANSQTEIRDTIKLLSRDEAPMVRRGLVQELPKIFPVIDRECLKTEFREMIIRLQADETESVREGIFEAIVAVMAKTDATTLEQHMIPLVMDCVKDKSWRVRLNVTHNFNKFQRTCPKMDSAYRGGSGCGCDGKARSR